MKKPKVYAYYFPNWHEDSRNNEWHGKGWTEWEVAKHATPRFEGHHQPKIPLRGYEDESDPRVMALKIDDAKSHAVDGFIFDWYWFEDGPYRLRALDEGFLGAENNWDIEFGVMWANHDPIYVHPASKMFSHPVLASGKFSLSCFIRATDHCIKNYFPRENYIRTPRGIYFSIYRLDMLLDSLGGLEGARAALEDFRKRVRAAGLGELDLNVISNEWQARDAKTADIIEALGFNSVSGYGVGRSRDKELPFPHASYLDEIETGTASWTSATELFKPPYNIPTGTGFDVSPRTCQSDIYGDYGYPFARIINDSTPELFERFMANAKEFFDSGKATGDFVTVYAWNEWTEGGFLEPDKDFGYGYLDAIKNVFGK